MSNEADRNAQPRRFNRRAFIKTGMATPVVAAAFPALAATEQAAAVPLPESPMKQFELDEITISDLQKGMSSTNLSA